MRIPQQTLQRLWSTWVNENICNRSHSITGRVNVSFHTQLQKSLWRHFVSLTVFTRKILNRPRLFSWNQHVYFIIKRPSSPVKRWVMMLYSPLVTAVELLEAESDSLTGWHESMRGRKHNGFNSLLLHDFWRCSGQSGRLRTNNNHNI